MIAPADRNGEQLIASHNSIDSMPRFSIQGTTDYGVGDDKKMFLTDFWKHSDVTSTIGFDFPGVHQLTGSCVGAGGGNAIMTLICVEVARLRQPEEAVVPFWLLPYGRSRYYLGDRGRGEGSTGATFARAAREDGVVPAKQEGLPSFTNNDALVWGSSTELSWSDGDADQTMKLLPESRKHLIKTVAQCRNADEVRDAIVNGYPCTCASMWGGMMQCPVQDGVLLNRRTGQWSHQMSILNWMEHTSHGEIYWIQNQCGLNTHGTCPTGAPRGGFCVKKAEVDWICRGEEVFAFSAFEGFPSQKPREFSWAI